VIVLEYQDGTFIKSKQGAGGIRCEIDKTSKKINVIMPQGTNLIERRTALRLADTIARSGYLLSTGERIGQGYQLVIDEKGTAIPERLKVSPRISYRSITKQD
jgi:hypothetical protein